MQAHILQHVPFEGPGIIAPWLERRGADVTYTRLYQRHRLPRPDAVDMLVILGGPMSVNDEGALPWLAAEKRFIRDAAGRGIPVLGICLGAQLIAAAMGARVGPNRVREIGWFPVRSVPARVRHPLPPGECTALHWHGETFDLPPGAVRIAESDGCDNQAFALGRNVLGLQFHLETTVEGASALLENCRGELVPGPYVQTADALRAAPPSSYRRIHAVMEGILAFLAAAEA